MILRRVIEHLRAQNWTAVALEFLMVAAGVFMGLEVQNWNQERQDRALEKRFLLDLHDDLIQAERVANRVAERRVRTSDLLNQVAVATLRTGAGTKLTEEQCTALSQADIYYVGFTGLPALDALAASGRGDVLRDRTLARALSEMTQNSAALIHAEQSLSSYGRQFRTRHNAAIRERIVRLPSGEYNTVGICDLAQEPDFSLFNSDLARAADALDAFVRDGVDPLAESSRHAHGQLDALLKFVHRDDAQNPDLPES